MQWLWPAHQFACGLRGTPRRSHARKTYGARDDPGDYGANIIPASTSRINQWSDVAILVNAVLDYVDRETTAPA